MDGPNKQACIIRSRVGQATVPIAHLINKPEAVSTVQKKHPQECNGISWLALCSACKLPLDVSVEGRHSDNEAMATQCQLQPWTSGLRTPCIEMKISSWGESLLVSDVECSFTNDVANDMCSILIRPISAFSQNKTNCCWSNVSIYAWRRHKKLCTRSRFGDHSFTDVNRPRLLKTLWERNNWHLACNIF